MAARQAADCRLFVALQERGCVALWSGGAWHFGMGLYGTTGEGLGGAAGVGGAWHCMSGCCVTLRERGCVALQDWV